MGTRDGNYGDACATARTEIMSELARGVPHHIPPEKMDWFVEMFIGTMHKVPAWALRSIANATDKTLPET